MPSEAAAQAKANQPLDEVIKVHILTAIIETGSVVEACERLKIKSPKTIYRKLKAWGVYPGKRLRINHLISLLHRLEDQKRSA